MNKIFLIFIGLLSVVLVFLSLLALAPVASAQKDSLINAERAAVFQAAVDVAKDHYTIVAIDREEMILSYRTPAGMRAATGYDVTATFERRPRGCGETGPACVQTLIRLKVSKRHAAFTWGGGDAASRDFFRWIEERLAFKPANMPAPLVSIPSRRLPAVRGRENSSTPCARPTSRSDAARISSLDCGGGRGVLRRKITAPPVVPL
jgi:hypothetical protein